MKFLVMIFSFLAVELFSISLIAAVNKEPVMGKQPQLSIDKQGTVRLVFGRADSIFCSTGTAGSTDFSTPAFVARISGMHLGMTRGPQIASSDRFSILTAMDKDGNIHSFLLNHATGKWTKQAMVNDVRSSAPEGLMSVAADDQDNFYAVWLDTRKHKHNNIFFSSFNGRSPKWSSNKLVYESPDGHVCECCKPSIAVKGTHVALMFRNWLNGSRDLYITESYNKGNSFKPATKLGSGTWKLDGCPMDGGGVFIDESNTTHTTWRREGVVYYSKPGEPETVIGNGKSCSIAGKTGHLLVLLQDNKEVKYYDILNKQFVTVGTGNFLKSLALPGGKTIFTWEDNGQIRTKVV